MSPLPKSSTLHKPWQIAFVRLLAALLLALAAAPTRAAEPTASVIGAQRILIVPVRFPGTAPGVDLDQLRDKIARVDRYLRAASYDKAWLEPTLARWYEMPQGIEAYRVSPHNYQVDPERVRRLVVDTLSAARRDEDLSGHDVVWILVGAFTRPGEGYGMICYAANPGMLSKSGGRGPFRPRMETIVLPGGENFAKPVTVSAENAHLGHVVHDLLHALGGVRDGQRVLPDLYDFHLQSHPPPGPMLPEVFAIHAGPWDIMSQHFIDRTQPPPAPSSFTRLRLGWITPEQVAGMVAGETREFLLNPLSSGLGTLVLRMNLDGGRYLLVENRQRSGSDAMQRAEGMLVLEVDPSRAEGTAIVRVADANPATPRLYAAPFLPGGGERRHYVNDAAGIAVVPVETTPDGTMRVRVTTPGRAARPGPD